MANKLAVVEQNHLSARGVSSANIARANLLGLSFTDILGVINAVVAIAPTLIADVNGIIQTFMDTFAPKPAPPAA